MNKDIDNIKRVVKDIRYLIATDCCDETIQARIENYIAENQGQTLPIDSVRLSCFKEVFEKFQEIEHESEFYGWLYAKAHEA